MKHTLLLALAMMILPAHAKAEMNEYTKDRLQESFDNEKESKFCKDLDEPKNVIKQTKKGSDYPYWHWIEFGYRSMTIHYVELNATAVYFFDFSSAQTKLGSNDTLFEPFACTKKSGKDKCKIVVDGAVSAINRMNDRVQFVADQDVRIQQRKTLGCALQLVNAFNKNTN